MDPAHFDLPPPSHEWSWRKIAVAALITGTAVAVVSHSIDADWGKFVRSASCSWNQMLGDGNFAVRWHRSALTRYEAVTASEDCSSDDYRRAFAAIADTRLALTKGMDAEERRPSLRAAAQGYEKATDGLDIRSMKPDQIEWLVARAAALTELGDPDSIALARQIVAKVDHATGSGRTSVSQTTRDRISHLERSFQRIENAELRAELAHAKAADAERKGEIEATNRTLAKVAGELIESNGDVRLRFAKLDDAMTGQDALFRQALDGLWQRSQAGMSDYRQRFDVEMDMLMTRTLAIQTTVVKIRGEHALSLERLRVVEVRSGAVNGLPGPEIVPQMRLPLGGIQAAAFAPTETAKPVTTPAVRSPPGPRYCRLVAPRRCIDPSGRPLIVR
jgi:hypothetical protein